MGEKAGSNSTMGHVGVPEVSACSGEIATILSHILCDRAFEGEKGESERVQIASRAR